MSFKFKRAERDNTYEIGFVDFNSLVGTRADLYYHNHLNEFQLGHVIFEVIEDENDGYRSSLDHVKVKSTSAPLRQKLAEIRVKYLDNAEDRLYQLYDTKDNHIWLEFGTNNWNDYYPCFVFNTYPKKP